MTPTRGAKQVVVFDPHPLRALGFRTMLAMSSTIFELKATSPRLDHSVVDKDDIVVVIDGYQRKELLTFFGAIGPLNRVVMFLEDFSPSEYKAFSMLGLRCFGDLREAPEKLLGPLEALVRGEPYLLAGMGSGSRLARLTPRQEQIAKAVADGKRNKEIAQSLGISPGTVKVHLMHIFDTLNCADRYELARLILSTQAA